MKDQELMTLPDGQSPHLHDQGFDFDARDAVFFAGLLFVMIGLSLVYVPLAFTVVGAVLVYASFRRAPQAPDKS